MNFGKSLKIDVEVKKHDVRPQNKKKEDKVILQVILGLGIWTQT